MRGFCLLIPFVFSGFLWSAEEKTFLESKGVVAIEAESTNSRLGQWEKKSDVADFQGSCHLEFTGNKPEMGPPKSPLKYHFQIQKSGKYQLTLRARKRLISKREDICNDCYVALKGDFQSATTAPMSVLKSDTKMFGGKPDGWGWTTLLDVNHKKHPAIYQLKAGEVYELTISGRSKNFNFDRILLVHEDIGVKTAQRDNPPESKVVDRRDQTSSSRPERVLTNREGRKIEAELMELRAGVLICLIKGRRYELPLESLSKADQEFLRKWNELR
ncbi:MAG: hypothetical protein P1U85_07545 [Verrucomicrobiales bacterium]|nr:hypothetical protein [Verrucomicrobiales bacterium]